MKLKNLAECFCLVATKSYYENKSPSVNTAVFMSFT